MHQEIGFRFSPDAYAPESGKSIYNAVRKLPDNRRQGWATLHGTAVIVREIGKTVALRPIERKQSFWQYLVSIN